MTRGKHHQQQKKKKLDRQKARSQGRVKAASRLQSRHAAPHKKPSREEEDVHHHPELAVINPQEEIHEEQQQVEHPEDQSNRSSQAEEDEEPPYGNYDVTQQTTTPDVVEQQIEQIPELPKGAEENHLPPAVPEKPDEEEEEDEEPISLRPQGGMLFHQEPAKLEDVSEEGNLDPPKRLVYDRDFLLQFRSTCTARLPDMPSFVSIYGMAAAKPPRRSPRPRPRPPSFHDHGETKPDRSIPGNSVEGWRVVKDAAADKENDSPTQWAPSRRRRPQGADDEDVQLHEVKGNLNKLTDQNFDSLFERILATTQQSPALMTGVVNLIFAKALQERKFANLYARLCRSLDQRCPKFPEKGEVVTFKKALLDQCQHEFEEREKKRAQGHIPSEEETDEQIEKDKRKTIGNVTFIGELYKEAVLPEIVMHICVKSLLQGASTDPADIEALCVLMTTIGSVFDRSTKTKGDKTLQSYYGQMNQLSSDLSLPSRVRCKLKDLLDLRASGWVAKQRT